MKQLKFNVVALAAFCLTLCVLAVNAAMKPAGSKPLATYHISASTGGANPIYTVTTSGSCDAGSVACTFTTTLAPDQPGGKYSRNYLIANGVAIQNGTFVP